MHKTMKQLIRAVYNETLSTLKVLELIAKLDYEKHFLRYKYNSLHQYLVKGLKYSDGAANRRIRAARLLAKDERVAGCLKKREVSLCTLSLIFSAPELLPEIVGKSKREVEHLVALRTGKTIQIREKIIPVVVTKPAIHSTGSDEAISKSEDVPGGLPRYARNDEGASTPPEVEERLKVTFSYKKENEEKIQRAREILSRKCPGGASIEELFVAGLDALIQGHSTSRKALGSRKGRGSKNERYIPAAVKRDVLEGDSGCCSYRNEDGSVCGSKWQLEIDHIRPLALGGVTERDNLRVLCRAHNQLAAKDAGLR